MHSSIVLSLIAGAAAVAAQSVSVYPPIDPEAIQESTRIAWCNNQLSACGPLCLNQESGQAASGGNTCDPWELTYTCICEDGKTPNASEYSQTMPYYICQKQVELCVDACVGNNICGQNCRANKRCGASDPKKTNKTTTKTKPSKTNEDEDSTETSDDTESTASSGGDINLSKSAGNSLVAFGEVYGVAIMVASFGFSIFAFLQ